MKRKSLPAAIRRAVMKRDGDACTKCGATKKLVVHHKTPVSEGGDDELTNLVVLCRDCHVATHMEREEYYGPKPEGYYKRKGEEAVKFAAEHGWRAFNEIQMERNRIWLAQRPGLAARWKRA